MDYMKKLLREYDTEKIVASLKGKIFLDIKAFDSVNKILAFNNKSREDGFSFSYVAGDEYLSGNIRDKISVLDDY